MDMFTSLASTFVFTDWLADNTTATFSYDLHMKDGSLHTFTETIDFGFELDTHDQAMTRALEALHLALGISYYKLYLPPLFELGKIKLDKQQAAFWNDLYVNGLGEFLYTNQISPKHLAVFEAGIDYPIKSGNDSSQSNEFNADASASLSMTNSKILENKKALLGIGGGKDSIVAGELLRELGVQVEGFVLEAGDEDTHTTAVAKEMGIAKHAVKRRLDPLLLDLNKQPGALNGHVPISAIFAFTGTVLALATQSSYVVVANEASASIPNTSWEGMEINHQWSKSFTFEQAAQNYIYTYIDPAITYFSAIRPLSSFAVCRLMSRMGGYFDIFTSCNRVARIDPSRRPNNRWCGECDKCLSTYILLAPWLQLEELDTIFNTRLLDKPELAANILALAGLEGIKPLDCVGTTEEIATALSIINVQHKFDNAALMKLLGGSGFLFLDDPTDALNHSLKLHDEQAFPDEIKAELLQLLKLGERY